MQTTLHSKRFQFLLVPAHGAAAIHRNTALPLPSPIKVWSRSRSRTIAYPSDSKVRSVYTGIWTSLMTVITFASTLQLHVSSGFCASVILRSGVTHRGGQDRVLLIFFVGSKPRIWFSLRFRAIHATVLFFPLREIRDPRASKRAPSRLVCEMFTASSCVELVRQRRFICLVSNCM